MSELCTHTEVGCTEDTLGQYPSMKEAAASIEGLKRLFGEAEQAGYGREIDMYLANGRNAIRVPETEEVAADRRVPAARTSQRQPAAQRRGFFSFLGRHATH